MTKVYEYDDLVVTRDGHKHRVLWQTKTDGKGAQLELRVKSIYDKHRKGYTIAVKNIISCIDRGAREE